MHPFIIFPNLGPAGKTTYLPIHFKPASSSYASIRPRNFHYLLTLTQATLPELVAHIQAPFFAAAAAILSAAENAKHLF